MSAWDDRFKARAGPALREVLTRWLEAEAQPMTRLEALRVVQEVVRLAEQVRDQRVVEARVFRHSWAEIAAAVGIARQSAHRRWHGLDAAAAALAEERERQFRSRQLPAAVPAVPAPCTGEEGSRCPMILGGALMPLP
jgi:hypothetical protein